MCPSSQRNAFVNVLFTALVILHNASIYSAIRNTFWKNCKILPGNTVDAFHTLGCESGLFLHVNPETRARVCCITVPLPKGFEYDSCEVNGGYDRIAKCPDGLYQVDDTTTASEAKCSSEIECNPDENMKISDCDAEGHCIVSCICNYDKGYCGLNIYDCQSFPSDCPRKWVQWDCTCKWKPTASISSALGNATNKPLQKIITTPSTVDGKSKTTEKNDQTLTGEDDQVRLIIRNNETGFIPDQKQSSLQHYEIINFVLSAVVISAFIIVLAVYCWKSKRNRKYQSVDQANENSISHDGGDISPDTDKRQPYHATIPQPPDEILGKNHNGAVHGVDGGTVFGSRERSVAIVKPQPNGTDQTHLISGLSTASDHVRYTSGPSAADDRNQISFSEQGALTMEGYSDFTLSVLDNAAPNEETAILKLDNQQEQEDASSEQQSMEETHTKDLHQVVINDMEDGNVASEQQSSEETHTKDLHQVVINDMEDGNVASEQQSSEETHTEELHQVVINNMEDDVPEDASLYSQFSSEIYHVTNA